MGEKPKSKLEFIWGEALLEKGFTALPNFILQYTNELGLSCDDIGFLMQLLSFHGPEGIHPSMETLARRLGFQTIKPIIRRIKNLEKKGIIARQRIREKGKFIGTVYSFAPLVQKFQSLATSQEREVAKDSHGDRVDTTSHVRDVEQTSVKSRGRATSQVGNVPSGNVTDWEVINIKVLNNIEEQTIKSSPYTNPLVNGNSSPPGESPLMDDDSSRGNGHSPGEYPQTDVSPETGSPGESPLADGESPSPPLVGDGEKKAGESSPYGKDPACHELENRNTGNIADWGYPDLVRWFCALLGKAALSHTELKLLAEWERAGLRPGEIIPVVEDVMSRAKRAPATIRYFRRAIEELIQAKRAERHDVVAAVNVPEGISVTEAAYWRYLAGVGGGN